MFGAGSLRVHLTMRRPRAVTTTLLLMCVSVSVWVCKLMRLLVSYIRACVLLYLYINMCTGVCAYVCLNLGSISEQ